MASSTPSTNVDALIVGAGFGGIYATHLCRSRGLRALCIDRAHGVGGTWYWNRYPGAMSDTESYIYRFSWDRDDLDTYPWPEHYVKGPEALRYLEHVVEKNDLKGCMRLGEELLAAEWDDRAACWKIETRSVDEEYSPVGEVRSFTARYLITALGLLSATNYPDINGRERYRGTQAHTGAWPKGLDLTGKKVGVIGSGSTGTQLITALAPTTERLVCFQRSPQYSVPSGDGPVSKEYRDQINRDYDKIWAQVKNSGVAFGFEESKIPTMSVSAEERRRIFQEAWDRGNGFRFMFGTFNDIVVSREANEEAQKFIKAKIREAVRDPIKAEKLMPREIYARRPLCDSGYYRSFNRESVDIVNLKDTPIEEMTERGIKTSDGVEYELDAVVYATGFDAIDGSYERLRIRGRGGKSLKEHWDPEGPRSYLGLCCPGFPNLFMLTGPAGPFVNIPPLLETQCEFIIDVISRYEAKGVPAEAEEDAERAWMDMCRRMGRRLLFQETQNWIFGANKPGKKIVTRFYFGGLGKYRKLLQEVVDGGHAGFRNPNGEGAARSVL